MRKPCLIKVIIFENQKLERGMYVKEDSMFHSGSMVYLVLKSKSNTNGSFRIRISFSMAVKLICC